MARASVSAQLRVQGNELFKRSDIKEAIVRYCDAIEAAEVEDDLIKALNNRALCYYRVEDFGACMEDTGKVLSLHPDNFKAYLRRGRAALALGHYVHAEQCLDKARELSPSSVGEGRELNQAMSHLKKAQSKMSGESTANCAKSTPVHEPGGIEVYGPEEKEPGGARSLRDAAQEMRPTVEPSVTGEEALELRAEPARPQENGDEDIRRERAHIVRTLMEQSNNMLPGDKFFVIPARWWETFCVKFRLDEDDAHLTGAEGNDIFMPKIEVQSLVDCIDVNTREVALVGSVVETYTIVPLQVWTALCVWYGADGAIQVTRQTDSFSAPTLLSPEPEEVDNTPLQSASPSPDLDEADGMVAGSRGLCVVCELPTNLFCGRCKGSDEDSKEPAEGNVWYCGKQCQTAHWPWHRPSCRARMNSNLSFLTSFWTDSNLASLHGVDVQSMRRGKVGLDNLGNTCFMSSAVQALLHCWPFTRYFLNNSFEKDLNKENFLGTGGILAKEYESLAKRMWFGSDTCIVPRGLKAAVARFAPQFVGFAQQDAQELMAYLLDGLHEDLNRVRDRPYTETPEHRGRPDWEVAEEALQTYKKRNDSIVVDLFAGQFKSAIQCPHCPHNSVVFDPFTQLPLELPTKYERLIRIVVIRQLWPEPEHNRQERFRVTPRHAVNNASGLGASPYLSQTDRHGVSWGVIPITMCVRVDKRETMREVRTEVARSLGFDVGLDGLLLVELYKSTILRVFDDSQPLSEVADSVQIAAYEVDVGLASDPALEKQYEKSVDDLAKSDGMDCEETPTGEEPGPEGAGEDSMETTSETPPLRIHTAVKPSPSVKFFLLHGQWTAESNDAMKEGDVETRLFSDPLPVTVPLMASLRELKRQAYLQVRRFASTSLEESLSEEFEAGMIREANMFLVHPNGRPATLPSLDPEALGSESLVYIDEEEGEMLKDWLRRLQLDADGTDGYIFLGFDWNSSGAWRERLHVYAFESVVEHPSETLAEGDWRRSTVQLTDCIEQFTKPEKLDSDNAWFCSQCKERREATKRMWLWRLPNILILSLKRFEYKSSWQRDKLDTHVIFPLEGLDLKNFVIGGCDKNGGQGAGDPDPDPVFDLVGVVNHYGRMGYGHYTALIREWNGRGLGTEWYEFDDDSVEKISTDNVCTSAAYLLIYRRRPA
mmetsp:Transcript_626/g.2319  ORF Transcript_626/g.2319 Transcript_626/m.2319 type:complete len:1165 (-) Transcript_626:557-4051(-)